MTQRNPRPSGNSGISSAKAKKIANDPLIKAMRVLLEVQENINKRSEIQAFIDKREAELKGS